MRVVAFDLWGDYGHFRRFFTTSSPLTYSVPPPTAVRGIVGALLGLDKRKYIQATADLAVGVRLLAPVKHVRWGINLIYTKGKRDEFEPTLSKWRKKPQRAGEKYGPVHSPTKVEYLKSPHFRLYLGADASDGSPLLEALEALLREHRTHYTLSLGLSELLADFAYVGTYQADPLPPGVHEVTTVFPTDALEGLEELRAGLRIAKQRMPIYLAPDRTPLLYQDVVVEMHGRPLRVRVKAAYRLDNEEVVYLWPPASTRIPVSP